MPENTKKVDRATIFGNPFPVEKYGRETALSLYRDRITGTMTREAFQATFPPLLANHLIAKRGWVLEGLPHLHGNNLACWCALPADGDADNCHAALLLELANRDEGCGT
jgi:hypothetical protein